MKPGSLVKFLAVLTKARKVPISTARQSSSRAAVPISIVRQNTTAPVSTTRPINTARPKTSVNVAKPRTNVLQKTHSPSRRPFYKQTALENRVFKNKVNTVKANSVNTTKIIDVTSVVGRQGVNAVKPLACWVWRPKTNVIDHVDPYVALKDIGIFNSGCSWRTTGNKSYLTDYQDYDGGFVAFAGSSRGGRITGKGKIKTANLDFEDVYFVKELKFNLFSVSQMCDKKNSILFTETECLILSPEFKLPDENHVMLKIPRKDNMYSFDLKNIVPSKAERKNRTLIEAARTMLADSLLPIPFWAEAVNTACYVQNKVLVTKPHNKTPYELLLGQGEKEKVPDQECILLPMMHTTSYVPSNPEEDISLPSVDTAHEKIEQESAKVDIQTLKDADKEVLIHSDDVRRQFEAECNEKLFEGLDRRTNSTNNFNTISNPLYTASESRTVYPARPSKAPPLISFDDTLPIDISEYLDDPLMPDLEDTIEPQGTGIFGRAYDDDEFYNSPFDDPNVGAKADFNNMEPS
ncbi:ribonuclease H-like domain-containing protein [Tanacetum coccineum]